MNDQDFENIVRQTIQNLPNEFKSQLDNVSIVIEDIPSEEDLPESAHYFLLGLYRGVPKTKRLSYSALPDKITIYKQPIFHIAKDEEDTKRIIRETVLHELGHHFGLSDEELRHIKKA
jgi:predicted Zn-dependent protease with MMP-like domain